MARLSLDDYLKSIETELNKSVKQKSIRISRTAAQALLTAARHPARTETDFQHMKRNYRGKIERLQKKADIYKERAAYYKQELEKLKEQTKK